MRHFNLKSFSYCYRMSSDHSTLYTLHFPLLRPDDWDDDDIQPLAYDGDNFGPHQTLPWPDGDSPREKR